MGMGGHGDGHRVSMADIKKTGIKYTSNLEKI